MSLLRSSGHIYSNRKSAIPAIVIDSLSSAEKERFEIGNHSDSIRINLSDVHMTGQPAFTKELHFVIKNDSTCIIVYEQGGWGSYNVIDYIKYKGEFRHKRYIGGRITNTIKLAMFLNSKPKPEVTNSN